DALAGRELAGGERAEALEIEPGVGEQRLVTRLVGLGLAQLRLERPRVDQREQIALLDVLALAERDLLDLAVDPHLDRDRVERLHGADAHAVDREALGRGDAARDGYRPLRRRRRGGRLPRRALGPEQRTTTTGA